MVGEVEYVNELNTMQSESDFDGLVHSIIDFYLINKILEKSLRDSILDLFMIAVHSTIQPVY